MACLLLRIGLAFTFLYAAVGHILEPFNWIGFFPLWLRSFIPEDLLLNGFAAIETALALWLLSGRKTLYSASLAAALFLAIVVTNLGSLDIVFRDFGLFFAALALAFLSR